MSMASWIETIANSINSAFDTARPALKSIPPILLLCELYKRPGLSAIALTSAIIRRLPEAGIETGLNPDGSENMVLKLIRIMCEEIIDELRMNARVTSLFEVGSIISVGQGANAGGPVVVSSTNTMIGEVHGIIR